MHGNHFQNHIKDNITVKEEQGMNRYNAVQQAVFEERWKEAVAPFKNVIWVKNGRKRLRVGGAHG